MEALAKAGGRRWRGDQRVYSGNTASIAHDRFVELFLQRRILHEQGAAQPEHAADQGSLKVLSL